MDRKDDRDFRPPDQRNVSHKDDEQRFREHYDARDAGMPINRDRSERYQDRDLTREATEPRRQEYEARREGRDVHIERDEPPRQGGRFDNMDRWQPGMRSDYSPQQDWRRQEFGVGPEYGPDYAFRDFGRADSIRDKWVHDLRERHPERDRNSWTSEPYYSDYGRSEREHSGERPTSRHGRFTGVGPKGYKRSDERIREDVCERLMQHPDVDASDIEVAVEHGEVRLSGTVPDRGMKRLSEDAISEIPGVQDVDNGLRIRREQPGSAPERAA
ncbi:MAG TPA: BON domain-containing protein [Terriglobales bacterium]|nr:BON domain-containing protein [Terriglobales bacterium]